MTDRLTALREQVRATDRRLQAAVRRRLLLARKIGRAKIKAGRALRDYAIERDVVDRWRSGLAPAGVADDRAEELARWMVEESVRVQEAAGPESPTHATRTDALVVGGAGQMGRWMVEFLSALGHRVAVVDPKSARRAPSGVPVRSDLNAAAREAALIAVATPMRVAPTVYRALWNSGTTAVVFDLLSIKAPLLPSIRRGRSLGFHVGSIHPLFGPQVRSLTNRNLLIVDCGDRYANRRLRELFERSSVRVTTVPLAFHDRWMVDALALPHATSLMFGLAMQRGSRRPGPASEIAPTSFLRQSDAARVISHENPELSFDIQTLNPGTTSLFERMERSLRALRKAVRTGNAAEYRRLMRAVAARIDGRTDDGRGTGRGRSRGAEPQSLRRVAGPRTRRTRNRVGEEAR